MTRAFQLHHWAIALLLPGALALVAAPGLAGSAKTQRIVVDAKLPPSFTPVASFQLTAGTQGKLGADTGKLTWVNKPDVKGTKDGQTYVRGRSTATFTGKNGTLVVAEDVLIVAAGLGVDVATGTWKVLRGSGTYRGVTGGGRMAGVFGIPPPIKGGQYPIRYEGLLTTP
jgi:hypothetical protein